MHTFAHVNWNVVDLEASLQFYRDALGLTESRRIQAEDGSFIIVFLTDGASGFQLELTWLRDWEKPGYDLGDNEFHLAFETDDFASSHARHEQMGCICFGNKPMGIYFVEDPDGYWLEIVPRRA